MPVKLEGFERFEAIRPWVRAVVLTLGDRPEL